MLREIDVKARWISFEPLFSGVRDVDLTGIHRAVIVGRIRPGR
jgi:protein gp37